MAIKCSKVVVLVMLTNVLTLTIYSIVRKDSLEMITSSSLFQNELQTRPLPIPDQQGYHRRMIQSVLDAESNTTTTDTEDVFTARKKHLDKLCADKKKHPTEPFVNDPSKLFVLKDRLITWCPVFKAGSSTWLSVILELSSKSSEAKARIKASNPGNYLAQGRAAAPILPRSSFMLYRKSLEKSNVTDVSFIVVRHPFERLVSAYRDKLERTHASNYLKDFYYKRYGKPMVEKFRKSAIGKFGDEFFSQSNNFGAPLKLDLKSRPSSDLPIFWEFAQYVIGSRKSAMDEHWKPASTYCSLCIIQYNYVIKFEDLMAESKAFLSQSKLTKYVAQDVFGQQHINPNRPGEMSSSEVTAKYFAMLSQDDVRKLYEVYADDFRLFNYTFTFGNLTLP